MEEILIGTTDRTVLVFIPDPSSTTGAGKTGLNAAAVTVTYTRVETDNDVVHTDVTSSVNDLSALTDAHNDWGWKEVSSTLSKGLYRLDIADAVFASGAWYVVVQVTITSGTAAATPKAFKLVAHDPADLGTKQTGDSYARLGAPAGASVSADIAGVQSDTNDIQTRLPAALTAGGNMKCDALALSGDTTAADNLEAILDGTGGTGLTLSTLTTSGAVTFNTLTVSAAFLVSGGTTFANAAGNGLTCTSSGGNGDGIHAAGNGTGRGMHLAGGATGTGFNIDAAGGTAMILNAGNGHGLLLVAGGTNTHGIFSTGGANGDGLKLAAGSGSGIGLRVDTVTASGAVTLGSTLTVTGATTFTGAVLATHASNDIRGIQVNDFTTAAKALLQTEAEDALVTHRLDELLNADSDIDGAAPPTVGSVFHELMSKTAGSFTFDQTTDSMEALRDRGDAAWITATGFSTHTAADVWSVATRVLTAGTNIVLAKGTGVTGFNDPTVGAIADAVWDEAQSGHTTAGTFGKYLDAQVSSISAGSGLSGPSSVTLTFEDASNVAVPLVDFTIVGQGSGRANASGVASFGLDNGTYTVAARPTGGTLFANATLVVSGSTSLTITGTDTAIVPSADPGETTIYTYCVDENGDAESGITVTIRMREGPGTEGYAWLATAQTATSAADGLVQFPNQPRGAKYIAKREGGKEVSFTTDDAATTPIPEMLEA